MSTAIDLFGEIPEAAVEPLRGKHYTRPKGYVAMPGTGPVGETCGSCAHVVKCGAGHSKQWHKCRLSEGKWTNGRGSDVLARSPACEKWQKVQS